MDDDFDDLIQEVENDFMKNSNDQKSKIQSLPKEKVTVVKNIDPLDNDIDAILTDIPLMVNNNSKAIKSNAVNSTSMKLSKNRNKKCQPIYLGGTNMEFGLGTLVDKKACDQLRCITCDFKVENFNNYTWHKSTDYLFLRNNMPDFDRLKSNLVKKPGVRSYACQCSWKSVTSPTQISKLKDLKWVCRSH